MLFGMGEPLKEAVARMGYFLRIYTPYGSLVPGMAYLIAACWRTRLNESFLRQSFAEHLPPEVLLADPKRHAASPDAPAQATADQPLEEPVMKSFTNERYTNFANAENREKMLGALRDRSRAVRRRLPVGD